jgi:hypothetical protein
VAALPAAAALLRALEEAPRGRDVEGGLRLVSVRRAEEPARGAVRGDEPARKGRREGTALALAAVRRPLPAAEAAFEGDSGFRFELAGAAPVV